MFDGPAVYKFLDVGVSFELLHRQFETRSMFYEVETPKSITTKQLDANTQHPLDDIDWLSKVLLAWLNPLIRLGAKQPLQERDVWPLSREDKVGSLYEIFLPHWRNELTKKKSNYGLALWRTLYKRMSGAALLIFMSMGMNILQPLFVKSILQVLEGHEPMLGTSSPYILITGLGLLTFGSVTCLDYGMYMTTRSGCHARSLTMLTVYRAVLWLPASIKQRLSSGEIVTLASLDSERLFEAYVLGLHAFSAPATMLVTMILVGFELDPISALVGAAVMIASVVGSIYVAKEIGKTRNTLLEITAERVRVSSETFQGIRVVKLHAWEQAMEAKVEEIRTREIRWLRRFHFLRVWLKVMMLVMPNVVGAASFIIYVSRGNTLTVAKAFSVLAFYNVLRLPAAVIPNAVTFLSEGITSARRVGHFISQAPDSSSHHDKVDVDLSQKGRIEMVNATFEWDDTVARSDERQEKFKLQDLSLNVERASLVMVIGSVGGGKTTLVHAILGDIKQTAGSRQIGGNISYVSQEPWIRNRTIRENILLGEPFVGDRYYQVLNATHLKEDLKSFNGGDRTEIGEFGINISGGQKARVSLARALYRDDFDILIMDDPLSALDVHIANTVFEDAVLKMMSGKTRVLVLNSHYHLLQHADQIIVMDQGEIVARGSFTEIESNFPDVLKKYNSSRHLNSVEEKSGAKNSVAEDENQLDVALIEQEDRVVGAVTFKTYLTYFQACGWNGLGVFLGIIATFTVAQASQVMIDWWVGEWAKQNEASESSNASIYIYLALTACTGLLVTIRGLYFVAISMLSSKNLHNAIFHRVLMAPINTFFDVTPVGRILNRFSRDIDMIDTMLPNYFMIFLMFLFQVISVFVICGYTTPWVLVLYIPMGYSFRLMQVYYQKTSRELKRFDGTSKSPILNLLSETLNGISTIRAFGMCDQFSSGAQQLIDYNGRFFFTFGAAGRWLAMRLDWISCILIIAVAIIVMLTKNTIDVALAGLALVYAVQLTSFLQRTVWLANMTENTMTAVERLNHYSDLENEDKGSSLSDEACKSWPKTGSIVFANVSMRYRPGLDLVLKNVSLDIHEKEKVGICGRTGSGKSSLIAALFRTAECEPGSCISIGGIDITTLPLQTLRSKISIIPQDPVLFSGTLRGNLDPFNRHTDAELWSVLRMVKLSKSVEAWGVGLDVAVSEKADNLSLGQRQILCIARALLRQTKFVVMDEATANVDLESDQFIQAAARDCFAEQTVLCIAHRLETIMDSDRILVMENGQVAEFDRPADLLSNPSSHFRSLAVEAKILSEPYP